MIKEHKYKNCLFFSILSSTRFSRLSSCNPKSFVILHAESPERGGLEDHYCIYVLKYNKQILPTESDKISNIYM